MRMWRRLTLPQLLAILVVIAVVVTLTVPTQFGSEEGQSPLPTPYQRPDVRALVASVKDPLGGSLMREEVVVTIKARRDESAATALWAAIDKAQAHGMTELYGVELFGIAEPFYQAVFMLRTDKGCSCLFVDQSLHGARDNVDTVPSYSVSLSVFARLRTRVANELPFKQVAALKGPAMDGEVMLVHILREGVSTSVLWHVPPGDWELSERKLLAFRNDFPIDTIYRALWAALPATLFGGGDNMSLEECYASAPAY